MEGNVAAPAAGAPDASAESIPSSGKETKLEPKSTEPKANPAEGKDSKKEEAAKERRKYKLKVDGAEEDVELTDDEIAVRLQKAKAADKRMSEAAELRKKFQQAVDMIKKDPHAALKDPIFGIDLDAIAEQRLIEKYRAEMMSEEERKAHETQKKLQEYEAREKERQAQEQRQQEEVMTEKLLEQTKADFAKALKLEGLSDDYETIAEMASVATMAMEYGIELTPEQMAAEVKARQAAALEKVRTRRNTLKGEDLLKDLGDEIVQEVLRASVAKIKGQQKFDKPASTSARDEEARERKILRPADFRKQLGLTNKAGY